MRPPLLSDVGGWFAVAAIVAALFGVVLLGGNADLLQPIAFSLIATLVVVPLAMFSAFLMLRMLLRRLDVDTAELHAAIDRVLQDPKAFAQFLGACVIGVCLLLGQVYR